MAREWFGEMPVAQDAEVAQADMIERLRAVVAALIVNSSPERAADLYDHAGLFEKSQQRGTQLHQLALALRALQPGDLGLAE
jgi:hypothetical protein